MPFGVVSEVGLSIGVLDFGDVLYLCVFVCVLLPDCHAIKREMKCQWFHRVAMVDFL